MTETHTVRLYPDTIKEIEQRTSFPEEAPFAQKAMDVLEDTPHGVTVSEDSLDDIQVRLERVLEHKADMGAF